MLELIPEGNRLNIRRVWTNPVVAKQRMSRLRFCTNQSSVTGLSQFGFRTFAGNLGQRADGLLPNLDVLRLALRIIVANGTTCRYGLPCKTQGQSPKASFSP